MNRVAYRTKVAHVELIPDQCIDTTIPMGIITRTKLSSYLFTCPDQHKARLLA